MAQISQTKESPVRNASIRLTETMCRTGADSCHLPNLRRRKKFLIRSRLRRSEASGMYKAQESADVIRAESEKKYFRSSYHASEHIPFQISEIRPVGAIFAVYILGVSDDTFI